MSRRPERSAEAAAYRRMYKTARWQRTRALQLARDPLCAMCKRSGRITPATVCDHVTPHKGDPVAFYAGPFQSLCAPCHDGAKQREEARGYSSDIGLDGLPIDPNHPFNRGEGGGKSLRG